MKSPFSFDGELSRPAYALASAGALLVQYIFASLVIASFGEPLRSASWLWLTPLHAIATGIHKPPWVFLVGMAATLVIDWLLVALAFRRTRHARANAAIATLAIMPFVQVLVVIWLSLVPQRHALTPEPPAATDSKPAQAIALGLLVGAALSVGVVAFSTLALHLYGNGLFVASPFVIGLTIAYFANSEADLGIIETAMLVLAGMVLGGFILLCFAFEGLICLIIAAPLIAAMGLVGGIFGRVLGRYHRRRRTPMMMSVAVLPLLLIGEAVLPPRAGFESIESVDVAASPAAVWDAVVHMGPIPDAPAVPFRWGLAYPVGGEILGTGVGAIRRGMFSTGVAYERVTEWEPLRKLSFIVLSDPPTMQELSPYQHVNAPHVVGYFKTLDARFTIVPLSDGKVRLSLATRHELDLEPALYWIAIAEWATHVNKVRVLQHFRQQAEAAGAPVEHPE